MTELSTETSKSWSPAVFQTIPDSRNSYEVVRVPQNVLYPSQHIGFQESE